MHEFHTIDGWRGKPRKTTWLRVVLSAFALLAVAFVGSLLLPPRTFPVGEIFTVEEGATLSSIAGDLQAGGFVRSAGIFKTLVIGYGSDTAVAAGDYQFEKPANVFVVATNFANGRFGVAKISVTLPEGLTAREMASILGAKLEGFNEEEFLFLAKDKEGYLFPDTYLLFPSTSAADVIEIMEDTFHKKIEVALADDFKDSDRDRADIITMASIIQDEALDGYPEKQMIAGILWKRIDKGMKLQVDASLKYANGKASKDLTLSDLAEDHPYNTYVHKGLPPTPIGNPGVDAVRAALNPMPSDYLFYLHDARGIIHYAANFDEHKKNINLYLK